MVVKLNPAKGPLSATGVPGNADKGPLRALIICPQLSKQRTKGSENTSKRKAP
jgi:hypothetical protein